MLNSEISNQEFFEIILFQDLTLNLDYNYIEFLSAIQNDFLISSLIINNQLFIFLKNPSVTPHDYYMHLLEFINSKDYDKMFYFTKSDELALSSIYKEFNLKDVKDWFMNVSKKIDKYHPYSLDQNLLDHINFELGIYNLDKHKHSKNFYFVELLLQHLEQKIAFSNQITRVNEFTIEDLLRETDYALCFSHVFPATTPSYEKIPLINDQLKAKLIIKGIQNLYTYQVEALDSILKGNNVVITAPTGNGKTESFLLPILHKIFEWKSMKLYGIKVIVFYPTKALASDQVAKIKFFTNNTNIKVTQLDSDVSTSERSKICTDKSIDILITTPDLIHYSLHKEEFRNFIDSTKIIVFDEVHTYTGTFGTHLYYFLRRLERVLHDGNNIQYIAASATIANPEEFTNKLFRKHTIHIDCTIPKKNKTELYCIQRSKRVSKYDAIFHLITILTQMLTDEKIIIFRNSQQDCEKTFNKLKNLSNVKVAIHRAGLDKNQRTIIEKQLRENAIDVVVTTTTLELGIDIGGITSIITPLVPVNRILQRIGRAGRGYKPAKVFLELEHDPISYYYSIHANNYLKDISPVNITTENESIAQQHAKLLQFESSHISENDEAIFKVLKPSNDNIKLFSLRNINNSIKVKTEWGYKITEKELPNAFYEYYPNAMIFHNSKKYKVLRIEFETYDCISAIVTKLKESDNYNYTIKPIIHKKVFTNKHSVLVDYIDGIEIKLSECFIQLEFQGNTLNYKENVLMDTYHYEYKTYCVIFNFEDYISQIVLNERNKGVQLGSTIHTLSHVLYKAARMIVYSGNDLVNMENVAGMWKIIFTDNSINGNGMSELFFSKRNEIWSRALQILHTCSCTNKEGCLKCTIDYTCQSRNRNLLKDIKIF